jgi:tetratricopeptide (TPR) repeat protein
MSEFTEMSASKTSSGFWASAYRWKKWWAPPLVLGVALLVGMWLSHEGPNPSDRYRLANQAMTQKNWQQAIDQLTALLDDSAKGAGDDVLIRAEAHDLRAKAFLAQGKSNQAIQDCTQAIALEPRNAAFYVNRGAVQISMSRSDLAIADFTQAIQIEPANVTAYAFRGKLYLDARQAELAIADLNQLLQLDPRNAVGYVNRSSAYALQGRRTDAIMDCSRAIECKPDYAEAYNNRAVLYYLTKAYAQAREDVKACTAHGGTPSPGLLRSLAASPTSQE